MSAAPADLLKSLLREAETALGSGEFEDVGDPAAALAAIVKRVQEDAIGAAPERLADLTERLRQGLAAARVAVADQQADARRRLLDLVIRTWSQQAGSDPATARELRRARRAALAQLASSPDEIRIRDLTATHASLAARSSEAPAARGTGPESLPGWIERVEDLIQRIGPHESPGLSAWETALLAAKGLETGAAQAALAKAAEILAAVSLEIEAFLLRKEASAHLAAEVARLEELDVAMEPDLRREERWVLEGDLNRLGVIGRAPGGQDSPALRVETIRQVLQGRHERAHARLQAALAAAREAGVGATELSPSADPSIAALQGTSRFLAGSARVEALLAWKQFSALEDELIGAIRNAWLVLRTTEPGPKRESMLVALADLKTRVAAEAPEAVAEALGTLEALLPAPGSTPAPASSPTPPAIPAEDLAALKIVHPAAAEAWRRLQDWAGTRGPDEIDDLLEQMTLEARTGS